MDFGHRSSAGNSMENSIHLLSSQSDRSSNSGLHALNLWRALRPSKTASSSGSMNGKSMEKTLPIKWKLSWERKACQNQRRQRTLLSRPNTSKILLIFSRPSELQAWAGTHPPSKSYHNFWASAKDPSAQGACPPETFRSSRSASKPPSQAAAWPIVWLIVREWGLIALEIQLDSISSDDPR